MASLLDNIKKLAKPVLKSAISLLPGGNVAVPLYNAITAKKATPVTTGSSGMQTTTPSGGFSTAPQAATFKVQPTPQVKAPVAATAPKTATPAIPRTTASSSSSGNSSSSYKSSSPAIPDTGSGKSGKTPKPDPIEPTAAEKAVADAEKLYSKSMSMSADELSTQGDLDRLSEATRKAYTGTENKAIPLEFITGQLQNIEKRALDLAQPLETRLARMEAARTNATEASKFALDRADKAYEAEQKAATPISIGGALVKKNADGTYETVYQAPETEKRSATYQEFLDAQKEGYSGTFDTFRSESSGQTQNQILARVDKLSNNFGDEPVVKRYSTLAEGYAFSQSIPDNSSNPADNQALIYAFAKAMDPDSVVREGEYATVQKYAQTWLDNFGFNAARVVNNQEFLSQEAVRNVKATIESRYKAAEKNYRNIYGTYSQRVREAGGDPSRDLVDYSKTITGGVGTLEDYYRSNPADQPKIDQMIQENPDLSDEDILQIVSGDFSYGGAGSTNRPQRNNNPLNIKASEATLAYPGVAGTDPSPATDGGQFLVFDSPESGFNAAATLLQTSGYRNLSVDAAMRRWSGGGYGGEVAPNLTNRTVASLSKQEIQNLLDSMAKREGYYA